MKRQMGLALTFVVLLSTSWCTAHALAQEAPEDWLTPERLRYEFAAAKTNPDPLPTPVIGAIVAAEDPQFFVGAAQNSAITQQLAKKFIKTAKRTMTWRMNVYFNATRLAQELSRDEIIEWYARDVWLGRGCYGFADAAETYFGKTLAALEVQDFALIAGLIKSPERFDPARAPDQALRRRNDILTAMIEAGAVSREVGIAAQGKPLGISPSIPQCAQY